MSCTRCSAHSVKPFNAEVAIHFPGWEGLEKPVVWAFPKAMICLGCGSVEFVLSATQVQQLKEGDLPEDSARAL